ncbi:MAG: hypothetical protein P4L40_05145 [Terracidiphilus sp.]|nr:hypothetical protein [Terracidiphilus sp.]
MTSNQMTAIQLLYCVATNGYFWLSLDGKRSVNIPYNGLTGNVADALQVCM